MARALIWFKRDLRIHDHAPLADAAGCDDGFGLVVIEPEWLASPECDAQHVAYLGACVDSLAKNLAESGLPLLVRIGSMPELLETLHRETGFTHLFSHEETGPMWSYARDLRVAGWCREHGVVWKEHPQTGVVRGLRSRDGWARRWHLRMNEPIIQPAAPRGIAGLTTDTFPTLRELGLPVSRPLPAAGEEAAWLTLDDFLHRRGRCYRAELSSPLTAERGCSRLSAHLACGTISLRQVHQATQARIGALKCSRDVMASRFAWHLQGFAGRLLWHCHFMQKLESEPEIELFNLAKTADGLRESEFNPAYFDAWREGRTGYPMVDACMRQLNTTGWLNFRMRAMLVSFAAYHLWLHWREPGLHLARQFLDFEPGIHWSQMQMQSGTTGINTLRIYSPARQAFNQDPTGTYVRRWVPEYGTADYPPPIVDERSALAAAKSRMFAVRRTEAASEEADAIQQRHGSRRSGIAQSGKRRRQAQRSSFGQKELFE